MPLYDQGGPITVVPVSGNTSIDALTYVWRWSGPITYSIPGAGALFWGQPSYPNYAPLDAAQQAAFRTAMAEWASIIATPVTEVVDGTTVGDVRPMIGWYDSQPSTSHGYFPSDSPLGGDIGFGSNMLTPWTVGSYYWMVLLHEIGHALGLTHPFDGDVALSKDLDDLDHTVMSYTGAYSYYPTTPMVLDIAAMQYMYGANMAWHNGDDVYTYTDAQPYHEAIWDAGGTDTIRYTGSHDAFINLRAGGPSRIGVPVTDANGLPIYNVWIANGVTIENAQGGSGNDYVFGNEAANVLSGGDGNDTIGGGKGDDTLVGGNGADEFDFAGWDNDADTVEDFGTLDRISVSGLQMSGAVAMGDGSTVARNQVQLQYAGGMTTLYVGTNPEPGAEAIIHLPGEVAANRFVLDGSFIRLLPPQLGQHIAGTAGDDLLAGTEGDDIVDGGAGLDTLAYAGLLSAYGVHRVGEQVVVTGAQGTDTLSNVERLRFGDGMAMALDVDGHGGEAYRLYQAAFDRAPDLPGLGFHIHDLDGGVPLWAVAAHFVESPEFQATYGALDDTGFITQLYRNVLNRLPEDAGLQFHLNEFAQGETRAAMLTHFSESPENQALVIGSIRDGMAYVPLA